MKITSKECTHCGISYKYAASGHVSHPELNDEYHCPDCTSAIIKALEDVPKKFEYRTIEVFDVTLDELLAADKVAEEMRKSVGGINARRCFPELYHEKLKAWTHTREIMYNKTKYILCEYPDGIHRITTKVRWDIQQNQQAT
jgi:hypothetical protein